VNKNNNSILELIVPFQKIMGFSYVDFYENCSTIEAYVGLLEQTYHCIHETIPSIQAVISKCPNHPLIKDLERSLEEEHGHDLMLLDDLKYLGYEIRTEPSPAMKEFIKLARDLTNTSDPVSALYGHIAVLDCSPRSEEDVKSLVNIFGVSIESASCFMEHAIWDAKHKVDGEAALSSKHIDRSTVINRAIKVCKLHNDHWIWMKKKYKTSNEFKEKEYG
jgi:hypothetical protein